MQAAQNLGRKRSVDAYPLFPYTALVLALWAVQAATHSAWAANECGVLPGGAGPVVTCTPVLNPYAAGIGYSPANGMTLNIAPGVVIDPAADLFGVKVIGGGAQPIIVNVADGVRIRAKGDNISGIYVNGPGPLSVSSGADIEVSVPVGAISDDTGAFGLFVSIENAGAVGDVVVDHRAGSTLKATGADGGGIYGLNVGLGSVLVTTSGTISTAGENGYGAHAYSKNAAGAGTATIIQADTGRITTNGLNSAGLYSLNDSQGDAVAISHGVIETLQEGSDGMLADVNNALSRGSAIATASKTAVITTQGDFAKGIWALHWGLGEASVSSAAMVRTQGEASYGLYAWINNASSSAQASIDLQGGGTVSTAGLSAHGLYARNVGTGLASVTVQPGTSVAVSGAQAVGVYALSAGNTSANIHSTVGATGEFGVGAASVSTAGSSAMLVDSGVSVTGGWQAAAGDPGPASKLPSAGVVLGSPVGATLLNKGTISAGSDRSVADAGRYTPAAGHLAIDNQGLLTGFIDLAPGGQNVLTNQAAGVFEIRHFADTDGDGSRDTKRVAVSDFGAPTSRFVNMAGATVRLAPVDGAPKTDTANYYLPTTGTDSRPLPADIYSLERNGIVQGQLVNLGVFQHAGVIDLRGPQIGNTLVLTGAATAASGAGTGEFVSDGGQLLLRSGARAAGVTDPGQLYSDMLVVDTTRLGAGGATRVQLDYDPAAMGVLTTGNGVELVEVRKKPGSASGVFALGNRVAGGAYEYTLQHGGVNADTADGNWYLRSRIKTEPTEPAAPVAVVPNYRAEVPLAMAIPALAHRLGLSVLGTYHDRAGEDYAMLASGSALQGYTRARPDQKERRAWGRVFGETGSQRDGASGQQAHYEKFTDQGPRYDFDLAGFQVGMDLYRRLHDDGKRDMAGAYLAASHLTSDVDGVLGGRAGKVSMDGYSLGAYWTHMGKSRWYVDAVVQATLYDGIKARSVGGETIKPNGWGFAASLEAGYPFALKDGWTLEPQAQLIYQRIAMDGSERDSFGLIRFQDSGAVYGRLGARLAKHWERDNGREMSAWVRANVWHSFGADAQTTFASLGGQNAVTLGTNLGGSWAQLGVGLTGQLADNLTAFVAVDYNQGLGSTKSNSVSGRIGVQYAW